MAPPTPRLYGRVATIAPAERALSVVASAEPSSTTSTSTPGSSPRTSRTTSAMEADSFQAGMTMRTRLPLIIARLRAVHPVTLDLRAQQRQVLGERAGLLLQPADLPTQVQAHQQQEDDTEEQHQADPGDHADRTGESVQQAREEREQYDDEADADPQHGVLLAQLPPPHQLEDRHEDDEAGDTGEHSQFHGEGMPSGDLVCR